MSSPDTATDGNLANRIARVFQRQAAAASSGTNLQAEPDPSRDLDFYKSQQLEQELKELKDNHKLRHKYASRIFWLVAVWLAFVLVAVFMAGFDFLSFSLSKEVLITFISSTTINVVGLYVVVAKWLFPSTEKTTPRG